MVKGVTIFWTECEWNFNVNLFLRLVFLFSHLAIKSWKGKALNNVLKLVKHITKMDVYTSMHFTLLIIID